MSVCRLKLIERELFFFLLFSSLFFLLNQLGRVDWAIQFSYAVPESFSLKVDV